MKNLRKFGKSLAVAGGSTLAMIAGSVHAADITSAEAALTDATSDVSTIGWAVFGVLVAAMAFKYMRRAL